MSRDFLELASLGPYSPCSPPPQTPQRILYFAVTSMFSEEPETRSRPAGAPQGSFVNSELRAGGEGSGARVHPRAQELQRSPPGGRWRCGSRGRRGPALWAGPQVQVGGREAGFNQVTAGET